MDFNGQHKTHNFAPPKGQVRGSNPLRDAIFIKVRQRLGIILSGQTAAKNPRVSKNIYTYTAIFFTFIRVC